MMMDHKNRHFFCLVAHHDSLKENKKEKKWGEEGEDQGVRNGGKQVNTGEYVLHLPRHSLEGVEDAFGS